MDYFTDYLSRREIRVIVELIIYYELLITFQRDAT